MSHIPVRGDTLIDIMRNNQRLEVENAALRAAQSVDAEKVREALRWLKDAAWTGTHTKTAISLLGEALGEGK